MSCLNFVNNLLHRRKIDRSNEMMTQSKDDDNNLASASSSSAIIIDNLQRAIDDKNRELKIKDETIIILNKELNEKDVLIKDLQNEIDKFRQVVRPITQKIITKHINLLGSDNNNTNGTNTIDDIIIGISGDSNNKRVQLLNEPRIKRQAISAEPLNEHGNDLQIKKVPKSAV